MARLIPAYMTPLRLVGFAVTVAWLAITVWTWYTGGRPHSPLHNWLMVVVGVIAALVILEDRKRKRRKGLGL